MAGWIQAHEQLVWWLGGCSVLAFVGTLLIVPLLVTRMPSDYFRADSRRPRRRPLPHPVLRWFGLLAKNSLGCVLLAAGFAMLVLPGQGVLTILVGIMLINFPGKYRLERWIVGWPVVHRSIDWIRTRNGRPPLDLGTDR